MNQTTSSKSNANKQLDAPSRPSRSFANASRFSTVTLFFLLFLSSHANVTVVGLSLNNALVQRTKGIQQFAGETFLPPIPPQEIKHVTLRRQFQPAFIAREFLLGARCMLKAVPSLMVASVLVTIIRNLVLSATISAPLTTLGNPLRTVSQTSGLHRLDTQAKIFVKPYMSNLSIYYCVTSPAIEEICYRGVGHFVGGMSASVGLSLFAFFCRRLGPRIPFALETLFLALHAVDVVSSGCHISQVAEYFAHVVQMAILVPAALEIAKKTRDEKEHPTDCVISEQGPAADTVETSTRSLAISRSARWYGATRFGAAHVSSGRINVVTKVAGIQKCVGTLCSSFLLESRLAVIRRTIWGSIGAHVTYNLTSTPIYVVLMGVLSPFFSDPLLAAVFGSHGLVAAAAALVAITRLLDCFDGAAARIERALSRKI